MLQGMRQLGEEHEDFLSGFYTNLIKGVMINGVVASLIQVADTLPAHSQTQGVLRH